MLERVFEIDIERGPNSGDGLKFIAAIPEAPVIKRILTHLGLQARGPRLGGWAGAANGLTAAQALR